MIAIVYIRVSNEDQVKHGYSLEAQEEMCKKKAVELGARKVLVFRDEGITVSILERPGLQEALIAAKSSAALLLSTTPTGFPAGLPTS
jgi:site-specific DNA recombinase